MKIPLTLPDIDNLDIKIVNKSLKSGWLAHGKFNAIFEKNFAQLIGTKYAAAVNSCTSALELALWANNITSGEIIIPSFTWVSTANVVKLSGCKPIFSDVDLYTRNITSDLILPLITKKTKAIIVVHYAGLPCDIVKINAICKKNKILLIEDSAECIGGKQGEITAGATGIGCFSFYPTKNITTAEGGILTTNNFKLIKKVKALSAHGVPNNAFERKKKKFSWLRNAKYVGRNFRMPDTLAALGVSQLAKLKKMNIKRNKIAEIYNKKFSKINDFLIQITPKGYYHSYQMYSLIIKNIDKKNFIHFLNSKGIGASSHFDPPVHKQLAYKKFKNINLANTEFISKYTITLPIYSQMKIEDAHKVSNLVCREYIKFLK